MKLYAISGLGADKSVFKYLNLDAEIITLDWIDPLPKETIESYAFRLSKQINTNENYGLLGVSFGGLIAVEIAKIVNPQLIILISSAETKHELRRIYKFFGKTKLINFVPPILLKPPNFIVSYFFGAENKQFLFKILKNTNWKFAKWAISQLITWNNTTVLNISKIIISGEKDKLLPPYKGTTHLIKQGQHFMIVDKANEISELINQYL